jgi:hypothetical protein
MADDANANVDPNANTKPAEGGDGGDNGDDKPVSRAEFTKVMERMQAADRRATQAEKERDANKKIIDDAETAKLGEVAKAQKEKEDALALAASQTEELKKTKLENAFALTTGVNWHDPSTAYAILQASYMDGVEIRDGKVEGMKAAIEKLAKEKPFLVNKDVVTPAPEATGSNHNRRAGSDAEVEKAREAELKRRMPGAFRHNAIR